jgi:hypothetical protein
MFGIINEFDAETIEPPKLVVSNPDIPETGQSPPKAPVKRA